MYRVLLFTCCGAFLFLEFLGCSSNSSSADESLCEYSSIHVAPEGPIEVGLFEEIVFEIVLNDYYGEPLPNGPIFVDFIGPAHNATVVQYIETEDDAQGIPYYGNLYTDDKGYMKVLFRAPDAEAEFSIRFSSPAVEGAAAMVDVAVDPSLLGLSLEVDYSGSREIDIIEAELFEELLCDDLEFYEKPVAVDFLSIDEYPGTISFSGLRNNYYYAVRFEGLNSFGETRAFECVDGLLPNSPLGTITLEDTILGLSGNFETLSHVETDGVLGEAVDELEVSVDESNVISESNFITNPHGAILDGIREVVVAMDPLDGEPFDEIREEHDLDNRLRKFFIIHSVDVEESMIPIWVEAKDYLEQTSFFGVMEIGSPSAGSYPVSHRIDEFDFGEGPKPTESIVFDASLSEAVSTVITLDSSNPDLIHIAHHGIVIGLGDVVIYLVREALDEHFATLDLAVALEQVVDCEAVTAYLGPYLSEVAASPAIESGCLLATDYAKQKLEYGATELNSRYATIEIEGEVSAVVPMNLNQVSLLTDGVLTITWSGEDFEGQETELGPVQATFEAALEVEE